MWTFVSIVAISKSPCRSSSSDESCTMRFRRLTNLANKSLVKNRIVWMFSIVSVWTSSSLFRGEVWVPLIEVTFVVWLSAPLSASTTQQYFCQTTSCSRNLHFSWALLLLPVLTVNVEAMTTWSGDNVIKASKHVNLQKLRFAVSKFSFQFSMRNFNFYTQLTFSFPSLSTVHFSLSDYRGDYSNPIFLWF